MRNTKKTSGNISNIYVKKIIIMGYYINRRRKKRGL